MRGNKYESRTFDKLISELLQKSIKTLGQKSTEYATEDKLFNFRQPTSMMNCSPAEVCYFYQLKHIASLAKIAKESSKGILPTVDTLNEKCGDMLKYTLIFYAIMREMIQQQYLLILNIGIYLY